MIKLIGETTVRGQFLKKILLIALLLFVLMIGFITFRFGSALSQEGNPIPILGLRTYL